jgi:hypothetical protein
MEANSLELCTIPSLFHTTMATKPSYHIKAKIGRAGWEAEVDPLATFPDPYHRPTGQNGARQHCRQISEGLAGAPLSHAAMETV